jgi:predicted metal-binding protein
MIEIGKVYTLDELKNIDISYYNIITEKQKFNIEIKNTVRHKIIESFTDFSKKDKDFLLKLKNEIFNNNDIYVFGSRVNGKYITNVEVKKYIKKYPDIKESDWDIQSLFKPDDELLLKFQIENNIKIDFNMGTQKIKI